MTSWQIDPAGVRSVLDTVHANATELSTALGEDKFQAILDGLTWGGGLTAEVPNALNGLFADQGANLQNINGRIQAALLGVSNATIAFNNGQYEMTATFQEQMLASAESGDFSWFEQNGYEG